MIPAKVQAAHALAKAGITLRAVTPDDLLILFRLDPPLFDQLALVALAIGPESPLPEFNREDTDKVVFFASPASDALRAAQDTTAAGFQRAASDAMLDLPAWALGFYPDILLHVLKVSYVEASNNFLSVASEEEIERLRALAGARGGSR